MALRRTIQVWSLVLLLSSILGPAPAHAAASAAATEKRHLVGRQAQGTRVTLARDELLVVQLTGRPAAGFSWHVEAVDGTVLTVVGREHDSAPGLGGEDTERLIFKGVAAGATSVTLSYRRAWDALRTGDELFNVGVDVAGPYEGAYTAAALAAPLGYEATGAYPSHVNLCDPGNGSYSKCTAIKDQGSCNGCWAFATTGVFENLLQFANPSGSYDLSEQYLISCNADGYSCANGGYPAFGLYVDEYVQPETQAGAVYGGDFPFVGYDTYCGFQAHPHHEKLSSWKSLGSSRASVETIKQTIQAHGPVWAGVCADNSMTSYTGGIFRGSCTSPNHAIVLVGWDDNNGDGYWLLRNSWGSKWGESGYMRIAYGASNVGTDVAYAVYGSGTPTNAPPIADAGSAQTVKTGAAVTLDGSRSRDTDGSIVAYSWKQTSGTPTVTLSNASAARATFVAPSSAATLAFTLTVTDDGGATDTATVTVTVSAATPAPGNTPPVADAGGAQSVRSGATVTLDGSASHDPDGSIVRYAWAQTSGSPGISLAGASTAQPTFIAPGGSATLGFTLTVTDDADATATATVTVTVGGSSPPPSGNAPPVADAGAPQVVVQGSTVALDGSRSWDGDGTIASYAWRQTAGLRVQLSDATAAVATFVAPTGPASLAFELVVTDDAGATARATVPVEVTTSKFTVGCSSSGSAAGLGSCALLWLAGLLGRRRRT
jgi:predicted secreted protein